MANEVIYKYSLPIAPGTISINLPKTATLLYAAKQFRDDAFIQLWMSVDPEEESVRRSFYLVPTGAEIPRNHMHIQTFILIDGAFVYHLYQEIPVDGRLI